MQYYKLENGKISMAADWQPDETWLKSDIEIVRGYDGRLYFIGQEPKQSIEAVRDAKLAEIVTKSNAIKAMLAQKYSALEEQTWAEQEAGARAILEREGNVKNMNARLILLNEQATLSAVSLVKTLAKADGVTPEAFSLRVVENSEVADQFGKMTLVEQRHLESAVKKATTVEEIELIAVSYTLG